MNRRSYIGRVRWEANVSGMDCASCAAKIERVVRQFGGVEDVRVDVTLGRMSFEVPEGYDTAPLTDAVEGIGYAVVPIDRAKSSRPAVVQRSVWRDPRLVAVVLGVVATVVGVVAKSGLGFETVGIVAYVAAILLGGYYVFKHAVSSLRHLHLDINVLMTIAVVGAVILGEWLEGATVVVLFAFAEWLEGASMARARSAIGELMELAPPTARVRRGAAEVEVGIDDVGVGELVVVRPGEKIPLDGVVRAGRGEVNQAAITGEALPVTKGAGDEVFAGTLNAQGGLEIEVSALASESTIAHVLRAIEEAQANRSESERFIERFARWYTPAVVALAALVAVVPPLAFGGDVETWVYRALVLLVIACPCALVIATPITTVSALARAARDGILVKGGRFLEHLGRLTAVVFDKTGTLTRGQPAIGAVVAADGLLEDEVLAVAALAERRSEHYVARAIVSEAAHRAIDVAQHRLDAFEAIPGAGVVAQVQMCGAANSHPDPTDHGHGDCCDHHDHDHDDHAGHAHDDSTVIVGTRDLLRRHGVDFAPLDEAWRELEDNGSTVVAVARDGALIGLIECSDAPRENAARVIEELRALGIIDLRICTGDSEQAGRHLARAVGLPETAVHAGLLPGDKVAILEGLRGTSRGAVAMIGDGINDAPALAAADVGVAMGAAGTDVALETAHVALMADDLSKLPQAVLLGRRTVSTIRANVILALGIKLVVLLLAGAGYATLWMAIAADMGTSLLVIGNGLRLLRDR